MSYFRQNIALDLGSYCTRIAVEGKGIVRSEHTVVAVRYNSDKTIEIGDKAGKLIGRTPNDIALITPVKRGTISSYTTAVKLIESFIDSAIKNPLKRIIKPDVIVCVPCDTTGVEKRAVEKALRDAGAGRIFLIEEPLASAVGCDLKTKSPVGNMIVNIGGSTVNIAVVSYQGVVSEKCVKIGGLDFDEAIKNFVRKEYGLLIGDKTAENLKLEVGSVFLNARNDNTEFQGNSVQTGLPEEITINSDTLVEPLSEIALSVTDAIKSVLEKTPPELSADIFGRGILLCGGCSQLPGWPELIKDKIGVNAFLAEKPEKCTVLGALKTISQMTDEEKIAIDRN